MVFHMKQLKKLYSLEQQPATTPVRVSEGGGELTYFIRWSQKY